MIDFQYDQMLITMNNFKSFQLVCAISRGRKSLAVGSGNSHRCNFAKAGGMFKRLRSLNWSLIWSLGKRKKKPHRFGYRRISHFDFQGSWQVNRSILPNWKYWLLPYGGWPEANSKGRGDSICALEAVKESGWRC
ncbi:hypothetical protein AO063_29255 [Pseudomonas fluorescens ICMP 11288]|uniref:Uncharacterized protein n=1 Tax=Pseudomonas fluorescens ICMP 11288 TaxID=1198309 RepID=A0A0W0HCQ0_PSEFL|nr:hypothetical protein AO063_29255 [Pseudomonas fluorescens ICMP 11288]